MNSAARACAALIVTTACLLLIGACDRGASENADHTRVITVWAHHGQEAENAAMRAIIRRFNEAHVDQKLRADVTFFPDRQYADKVSIAAVTGALPDVLDVDGPFVGPWAADGLLQPIGKLVDDALREDLLPSLIEQGTYEGKLYALGAFESALVVYYNREMISAAGLNPPASTDEAWTWDEFVAALEKVKPHAPIPLSLHMDDASDEWFTYAFSPLIWSNGGRLIAPDRGHVLGVLDSADNVAVLQKWRELFTRQLADPRATNPNPFASRQAAFDWTGHWLLPTFEQTDGLEFGVMPLPKMGDAFVAPSGSWCWGISRDCDQPAQAWELVAWLLHPEHGVKPMVEANGAVPGRRSAFQFFPAYQEMPRRLFRRQLEHAAHPRPRTAVYLTLTTNFARALRDIATGADVEKRLRAAAEEVQQALDRRGGR